MLTRWPIVLVLIPLALAGCSFRNPAATPEATRASVQEASPATASPVPDLAAISPEAACSPDRQASALRPGMSPDWAALPVSACYQIELELLPDDASYRGRARVTIQNQTEDAWPDLVFRLYPNSPGIYGGEMMIDSAAIDGSAVESKIFLSDRTGLLLDLKEPLQPGESAQVELEFEGKTPLDLQDTTWAYGVFNTTSSPPAMILANSYPLLAVWEAGDWQAEPVIAIGDAVVSETALYDVAISAPLGWQVVSTGTALTEQDLGQVTRWEAVSGPVREFMVTASPEYTLSEMELNGITLRHWGLPGGNSRWQEALQAAADSTGLFGDRFGAYPYNELDVVAATLELALGVEYPGLFLIQQDLYQANDEQPFLLGLVVAHEAAHQWWYGMVGNNVLVNPWMDEALATYGSLLYQQEFQPQVYPGTLAFYSQNVADAEKQNQRLETGMAVEDFVTDPGLYSRFVYQKGGLFFAGLREKLGDQAFFAGLQGYFAGRMYQTARPEDLLTAFETSCACELDPFFAEWGLLDG